MHFCEIKKSFIVFEVININFWEIWYFDIKDTGWVDLQLRVILTQIVGRFNMYPP